MLYEKNTAILAWKEALIAALVKLQYCLKY